ncbi:porin [Candidatus Pelagibacter sp.]|jgi:outer membrane protein OmpU|nr:porin [Candidatus Pelagibacter sp.]
MNIKKIGLTALAGSLVATSAFAGALTVSGGASLNVEHTNGGAANTGKTFSMGNSVTFTGSGELDNGLTVSLSFELDKGEGVGQANAPFDSHSLTISSDSLGSLNFAGHGGSSATSAVDGSAAGDIWDQFDDEEGLEPNGVGSGDNMMLYTLPSLMDGLAANVSYIPAGSGTASAMGYGITYTGVDGLSVTYATGDDSSVGNVNSATVLEGTYAYGPVTVSYSDYEYDAQTDSADDELTAYKLSYTISDELSVSYASEEITTNSTTAEYEMISASYTAGGMTITAAMSDATDIDGTTAATEDRERWALSASFAF